MKFHRDIRVILTSLCLICLGIFALYGCASQPQNLSSSRIRNWQFEQVQNNPRVAFIPKGLYIVGLKNDQSYGLDSWVRLVPGELWPAEEPRPTLLIGRVVERQKTSARLEILALQSGIREHQPGFELYPESPVISQNLHAITKKLIFASSQPDPDSVVTTYPDAGSVMGNELYAAIDLNIPSSNRRLAAQASALLQAVPDPGDGVMHLTRVAGKIPENSVFVLLDAPLEPAFDVRIRVTAINHQKEIIDKIQKMLAQNLPGMGLIRVMGTENSESVDDAIVSLGGVQTDTLEVSLVTSEKSIRLVDQALRILDNPWTVIFENDDPDLVALSCVSRALEMLGYQTSSAWILEQALLTRQEPVQLAAIAPSLASDYQAMGRSDWAFEIALELLGYADSQSKKDKLKVLTSAAAVLALSQRATEYPNIFDEVDRNLSNLPDVWRRLFAFASVKAEELPKSREYLKASQHPYWTEYDQMFACYSMGREEQCQPGLENAQSEIGKLWFKTFSGLFFEKTQDLLNLAAQWDEIGAPLAAYHIWFDHLLERTKADTDHTLLKNAALYARRSPNTRLYLSLMSHYLMTQSISSPEVGQVIGQLSALDLRENIAELCMSGALSGQLDESIRLLEIAVELYLSIGDAENAAIALARLSQQQAAAGQEQKANELMTRAQQFGHGSHQKEVLQALHGDSESAEP